ncbi:MAG: ribosome recycling factor, partial [Clostridia bacterium]|nr:ribosome recycling factor [Clostridia bacterium]
MKLDTKEFEEKMNKTVDAYRNELTVLRAGRATPDVLSRIRVDYYGSPTPITGVAAVSVPDARTLTITPWDPS